MVSPFKHNKLVLRLTPIQDSDIIKVTKEVKSMVIDHESLIGTFEQQKKLVSQFNLMDDDFFSVVMTNKEACQFVIRTLTGIEDLTVIDVKTQYSIRNLGGHSVILDCYAEDSNHKIHNIEIQVKNNDNQPKRVRYYRTAIDFSIMEKGCSYEELPDVYMIFISAFDMFGLGRNHYEGEKRLKNSDYIIDDGVHELYFNTAVDDGTPLSELLQYFKKSDPNNNNFGALSEAVRYQKETAEGVGHMCQAVERYGDEREKQGVVEVAKSLLKDGMTPEKVAQITKLALEEVEKLIKD